MHNDAPLLQDAPRAHTPSLSLSSRPLSRSIYLSYQPMSSTPIINIARTGASLVHSKSGGDAKKAPKTRSAVQTTRCCSAGDLLHLQQARAPPLRRFYVSRSQPFCWKFWCKCELMTRRRPTDQPAVDENPSKEGDLLA